MMIRFTVDDGHGPIDLFGENQTDHLMRECHARKRDFLVCLFVDARRETVGSAHDEHHPFQSGCHPLFHPCGELHRTMFPSVFVQQDDMVARLERFQQQIRFFLLLLFRNSGMTSMSKGR